MTKLKVLLYPEPINRSSGPMTVVRCLSSELATLVQASACPGFVRQINNSSYFGYLKSLSKSLVMENTFDIIHFLMCPCFENGTFLLPLLARTSTPIILNVHGIRQIEYVLGSARTNIFREARLKLIDFLMCKKVTKIVVNSFYMQRKVAEYYGIDIDKIVVIPNGVNISLFNYRKTKKALMGSPCILFVGNFSYLKGADTLIRAIALARQEFPEIRLHIVGNSEPISDLADLIKSEGVEKNVIFHGWVEKDVLPNYYRAADFCIFPSVHEGFGQVVLEAMASHKAIIVSNIPTFRERLLNYEDALFFRTGDPYDLHKKIVRLTTDPFLRKRLGSNAFKAVQRYDWHYIALEYLRLYHDIISRR